jgi:hypothetical protein
MKSVTEIGTTELADEPLLSIRYLETNEFKILQDD